MQKNNSRTALLIAYHFPPCSVSSGLQRTLSFSKHLSSFGWRAVVLSATPGSYVRSAPHQLADIPHEVLVKRTIAPDASRHLAIQGRFWSRLAVPDRWRAWWLTALPAALRLVKQERIDLVWSTYPIATAHTIGCSLSRRTGLPWIADFRDPMVEHIKETDELFPKDPVLRRARLKVEADVARYSSGLVFCTESAKSIVAERYPRLDSGRLHVISNGYEEGAFPAAERKPTPDLGVRRRILLHSGTIYASSDRDPSALFIAISELKRSGIATRENFELRLRDPSNGAHWMSVAEQLNVSDLVNICPTLPYRAALAEMLESDGLLVLQGYTSNPAIPAKLYEYLRARQPIIALVDSRGETAQLLRRLGIDTLAPLDAPAAIRNLLLRWLQDPAQIRQGLPSASAVAEFSRGRLTERLARLFDQTLMGSRRD